MASARRRLRFTTAQSPTCPGLAWWLPASSINLIGTMRAVNLTNLGSGWVVSTPPSGGPYTRRVGTTAEAAECHLERTGKLCSTRAMRPVAGEQIAVVIARSAELWAAL